MAASNRILTLDVGASKILLCEFSVGGGSVSLLRYAVEEIDPLSGESPANALATLGETVKGLMQSHGIAPAPLYVALSGQSVFPRFVKVPAASGDMVDELVTAEATSGLPFPLDQVVWDYQTLGIGETGDLDTLIVASKRDTAMDAVALAKGAGLDLALLDASPLSLYNAAAVNSPSGDSCTLVLDIGAKTTNLVFIEGEKVFLRTIPVAGNTFTNEIVRALGADAAEAEQAKKEIGFVALGGNYAVTDDEVADHVSKAIRNGATRLHSEIIRSINFYRSQQSGSAPSRVLLTGGTANLRHLDTFFQEKLGVEVSVLNPFAAVSAASGLQNDPMLLSGMAVSVGMALRATSACPVQIDLLPQELVSARQAGRRIPAFVGGAVALVAGMVCLYLASGAIRDAAESRAKPFEDKTASIQNMQRSLSEAREELDAEAAKETWLMDMVSSRATMSEALAAVREALLPDMWITSVSFVNYPSSNAEDASVDSDEDESEAPPVGVMHLTVRGYEDDLAAFEKAEAKSKGTKREQAVRLLREKLFQSPIFSDLLPYAYENSSEKVGEAMKERDAYKTGLVDSNSQLREITLHVRLARPVGTISSSWSPVFDIPEEDEEADEDFEEEAESEDENDDTEEAAE